MIEGKEEEVSSYWINLR